MDEIVLVVNVPFHGGCDGRLLGMEGAYRQGRELSRQVHWPTSCLPTIRELGDLG
jgi:hypothetical protein